MRVLMIKLSSFGDILHAVPVATALRRARPDVEIDWLIKEQYTPLLQSHRNINKLLTKPESGYDYVLDLQGLMKTAWMARGLGREIIGFSSPREWPARLLYTQRVNAGEILDPNIHIIEKSLKLLEPLGINDFNLEGDIFEMPERSLLEGGEILSGRYIVLTTQTRWQSKEWINYSETLEDIVSLVGERDWKVVLLGSERQEVDYESVLNLTAQTTFQEMISIVANAGLVIAPDTGILHLASAYQVPSIGLFGATSPSRTGAWSGESLTVGVSCSPCHKRKCPLKNEQYMQCMQALGAEELLMCIAETLKKC